MPEKLTYTSSRRRSEPIEFELDGDTYTFTPPKTTTLVLPILGVGDEDRLEVETLKGVLDWLGGGLPKDQEERIEKRLRDPRDDLDLDVVVGIAYDLLKKVAGAPLAAQSASSE